MSQPRHKRKQSLIERDRAQVSEYDALRAVRRVLCTSSGQRVLAKRIKFLHACARIGAYELFKAAVDLRVPGYPDWWKISGHYQVHNRHTKSMGTNTRKVMDLLF